MREINQMEDWEKELDNIDWKMVLDDINKALIDNLAAELGFPSYDCLEQASERVFDDYYVVHLSDGRWAWWNPTIYAKEDPLFFENKLDIVKYIAGLLNLDHKNSKRLELGLDQLVQMRRCRCCQYEYNPQDPSRMSWDTDQEQVEFCSADCAMEYVLGEMKEHFGG